MRSAGTSARWWPWLALSLAVLWPLREAVFAGSVLYYRDIHLSWHPAMESFARGVAEGSWPLWNPCPAFGQPMLADPEWMLAYPPTWLNLVLPPWVYYTLFAAAHLFGSALGAYRLSRRWRCGPLAATTAACAWCLSGPALSLVSLYHHFASACWMPWVVLAAERALLRPTRRSVLACALAMAAQIAAGSADMTAMTWLAVAAYAAVHFVRWRAPWSPRNRRLLGTGAAAAALGLALSAIVWLPALELVSRSARHALPAADTRTYWSLHPLALLEAWVPGLWHVRGLRPELSTMLFEGREPFLDSIYLGLATLPLAAAAFAGRRPRRHALGALAAVSLLVALGRHFVAYSVATTLLPPLSILRYPIKSFVLFAWAWALLCGQGVEAWRRVRGPSRPWALVAGAQASLALALAIAGAWLLARPARLAALILGDASPAVLASKAWMLFACAAVAALAAAVAWARWRGPRHAAAWAAAAALLAIFDLGFNASFLMPTAPRELYARPPVVDLLRRSGAQRLVAYSYTFGGSRRLQDARAPTLTEMPEGWSHVAAAALAQQLSLVPNAAGRWGLESGFEADPTGLQPHYVAELGTLLPLLDGTPLYEKLLRIGGVTHVVSLDPRPELGLLATLPVLLEAPLRVSAVPDPLPRAYAVGAARAGEDAGALLDSTFDPAAEVVLPAGGNPLGGEPGIAGRVAIEKHAADRVTLVADMDRTGWLVLLDTFDPGWQARVDGSARPLLRANVAFRALRLDPGRHRVEMVYRPWPVKAGAGVTALAVMAAVLLGLASRRRG